MTDLTSLKRYHLFSQISFAIMIILFFCIIVLLTYWIRGDGPVERDKNLNEIQYYLYGVAAGFVVSLCTWIYFQWIIDNKKIEIADYIKTFGEYNNLDDKKKAFIAEFNNIKDNITSSWL